MLTGTRQNQIYNDRIFSDTDLETVDLDDHLCVATSVSVYQSLSTALCYHPAWMFRHRGGHIVLYSWEITRGGNLILRN